MGELESLIPETNPDVSWSEGEPVQIQGVGTISFSSLQPKVKWRGEIFRLQWFGNTWMESGERKFIKWPEYVRCA